MFRVDPCLVDRKFYKTLWVTFEGKMITNIAVIDLIL